MPRTLKGMVFIIQTILLLFACGYESSKTLLLTMFLAFCHYDGSQLPNLAGLLGFQRKGLLVS